MKKDTCILLFSRSVEEESKVKSFGRTFTRNQNAQIAQNLIAHTLSIVKSTEVPYVYFSEMHQLGGNFGERLSNAVKRAINAGYKRVLIVGNDCPTLTHYDLLHSISLLKKGQTVVGPTHNGGAYIIGLQSASFDEKAFCNLRWNTTFCFDSLLKHYADEDVCILPEQNDLNVLTAYMSRLSIDMKIRIGWLLKVTFLGQVRSEWLLDKVQTLIPHFSAKSRRGPPRLSHRWAG